MKLKNVQERTIENTEKKLMKVEHIAADRD